jgi:hypothetical protein
VCEERKKRRKAKEYEERRNEAAEANSGRYILSI